MVLRKRFYKGIGIGLFSVLLLLSLFFLGVYLGGFGELPTQKTLSALQHSQSSEILDANGMTVGYLFRAYHSSITFDDLPPHLVNALISTEDARFYHHDGIDYRSLIRVLIKTILLQDQSAGGGSTLTQQLAKNLYPRESGFLSLPVSKLKEFIIASRLEQIYTKQEIISLYLNTVTFSDNTSGITSAARTFFNKSVSDLNLQEVATLVGMLKATYTYNPRVHPEKSLTRRNVVLNQMVDYKYLSKDSADRVMTRPIVLSYKPFDPHEGLAPYFREHVRKTVTEWTKENKKPDGTPYDIYADGLKIYTTLDVRLQQLAEESMRTHMTALQKSFEKNWGSRAPWVTNRVILEKALQRTKIFQAMKNEGYSQKEIIDSLSVTRSMNWFSWEGKSDTNASVVDSVLHHLHQLQCGILSIEPSTGAVKVWIGGIDHRYFQFDHISQGKRQVGSTFKPIVYAAALEQGVKPCDYFSARTVTYSNLNDWTPDNNETEGLDHKNYSMKAALSKSLNTVSVKVLEAIGIDKVIEQAGRLNITSVLPRVPSIVLGSGELSMLELAGAYAAFVNDGKPATPYFVTKITDKDGKVLATFEPENHRPAFSKKTQLIMLEMLQSVVNDGTASSLRWKYSLNQDMAGKTGTTQGNKDGWFVGVTPNLITVTWVGADDYRIGFKDTRIGQGANSALPIFGLFMQKMNSVNEMRSISNARFPEPSSEIKNLIACPDAKEDNFLQKLFTDNSKTKEFGEKQGFFSKLKRIFKKNKD